jgi:hypothetical protein
MPDVIELKNRQIVDVPVPPTGIPGRFVRKFGVALDNDEAQDFIKNGLRVHGDENGPYLVVRLKSGQPWPLVMDKAHVDVAVEPRAWVMREETGIICWLKSIGF